MHLNSVTAINLQTPHARQGTNATMLQLQLAVTPDHRKIEMRTPRGATALPIINQYGWCAIYILSILLVYIQLLDSPLSPTPSYNFSIAWTSLRLGRPSCQRDPNSREEGMRPTPPNNHMKTIHGKTDDEFNEFIHNSWYSCTEFIHISTLISSIHSHFVGIIKWRVTEVTDLGRIELGKESLAVVEGRNVSRSELLLSCWADNLWCLSSDINLDNL